MPKQPNAVITMHVDGTGVDLYVATASLQDAWDVCLGSSLKGLSPSGWVVFACKMWWIKVSTKENCTGTTGSTWFHNVQHGFTLSDSEILTDFWVTLRYIGSVIARDIEKSRSAVVLLSWPLKTVSTNWIRALGRALRRQLWRRWKVGATCRRSSCAMKSRAPKSGWKSPTVGTTLFSKDELFETGSEIVYNLDLCNGGVFRVIATQCKQCCNMLQYIRHDMTTQQYQQFAVYRRWQISCSFDEFSCLRSWLELCLTGKASKRSCKVSYFTKWDSETEDHGKFTNRSRHILFSGFPPLRLEQPWL